MLTTTASGFGRLEQTRGVAAGHVTGNLDVPYKRRISVKTSTPLRREPWAGRQAWRDDRQTHRCPVAVGLSLCLRML